MTITVFQALAHGMLTMILSLMRQMIFTLPPAWFLARFFGVDWFWLCYPLSEFFATFILVFVTVHIYRKEIRNL